MSRRLTDREVTALLRGPLAGFVADLESLADAVPDPSGALAAMLEVGVVPESSATAPSRRRRWVLLPVPLTVLLLGGTVGAASANVLPDVAQRVVSDTFSSFTPLDLPRPADKPQPQAPAPGGQPSMIPSSDPQPQRTAEPGRRPTAPPSAVPSRGASDAHRPTAPAQEHRVTPRPTPRPADPGHQRSRADLAPGRAAQATTQATTQATAQATR